MLAEETPRDRDALIQRILDTIADLHPPLPPPAPPPPPANDDDEPPPA